MKWIQFPLMSIGVIGLVQPFGSHDCSLVFLPGTGGTDPDECKSEILVCNRLSCCDLSCTKGVQCSIGFDCKGTFSV